MGKIATYQYLYDNFGYIESYYPRSQCPTYQDISDSSLFSINGTYGNLQLVQEEDIVANSWCYIVFMGLMGYSGTMTVQYQISPTGSTYYTVQGSPDPDNEHAIKAVSGIKITSVTGTVPINTTFNYSMRGKLRSEGPQSSINMTAGTWYNFSGSSRKDPFIITITGRAV